jgi:hypothetical protein
MPHSYTRWNAGPSTVAVLGVAIHNALVAAGWTYVEADADALTGGSGGNPGWGKTAVVSTTAGKAVYRMPLNGQAHQWYVLVTLSWGGSTNMLSCNLRSGKSYTTGSFTFSDETVLAQIAGVTNNNQEAFLVANEDGLMVVLNGTGNSTGSFITAIERARDYASGATLDDIVHFHVVSGTTVTPTINGAVQSARSWPVAARRNWTYDWLDQPIPMVTGFGAFGSGSALTPSYSVVNPVTGRGRILGPYFMSGGLSGPSRLVAVLPSVDALGSDQLINLGDADRYYYPIGTTSTYNNYVDSNGRVLIAKEA